MLPRHPGRAPDLLARPGHPDARTAHPPRLPQPAPAEGRQNRRTTPIPTASCSCTWAAPACKKLGAKRTKSGAARCFSCRRAPGIRFIDASGLQAAVPGARFRPGKPGVGADARRPHLTLLDLKKVRRELALLTRWRTGHEEVEPREAAAVLRLIDLFFRALDFLVARCAAHGRQPLQDGATRAARAVRATASRSPRSPAGSGISPTTSTGCSRRLRPDAGRTARGRAAANRPPAARGNAAHGGDRRPRIGFRRPQLFFPLVPRPDGRTPRRPGARAVSENKKVGFVLVGRFSPNGHGRVPA